MFLFGFWQEEIDPEVKVLLSLKAEYKSVTNEDWKPPTGGAGSKGTPQGKAAPSSEKKADGAEAVNRELKKITR